MLQVKEQQQKSSLACNFCSKSTVKMIEKALYDRYSSSQNFYYSKEINQLISDDLTKATVDFLQWQVRDDQDQFLKRQYKISEYPGKSKSLGDYYQYHRQLPRFFGLPIEIAIKRYHQKVRDHEYKVVKRMMNETEESLLDPSMIPSQNSHSVSEMSNVLRLLDPQDIKVEESVAFLHVVQELKELTKNQLGTIDIKGDFYKTNNSKNFQQYLQKISKRKRKGISIESMDKRSPMHRTQQGGLSIFQNKELKEQQQKLIIKNYDSQNYKYKGKLSQRVDTLLNGLQKTKPLLKNTLIPQLIPHFTKVQRQRSIERIYGADRSSYNSLTTKLPTKVITLQSDRLKGLEKFRISQSTKKIKDKQATEIKTIDYRSSNRSLDKKQFKIESKEMDANSGINTTRRKELSGSKSILKKKSQSVPNIKTIRTSRQMEKDKEKKLDPIKIYKKIKGLI